MKTNETNYERAVMNLRAAIYWLTSAHFDTKNDMLTEAEIDFERCWEQIDNAVKLIQKYQDETKPF